MTTRELSAIREVADGVEEILEAISDLQVSRSDVPEDIQLSSDGKVNGYAVFYPGTPVTLRTRLAPQPDSRTWVFQITCVGGDDNRCLRVVDKVSTAFSGLRLPYGDPIKRTTPIRQEITGPDVVQIDRAINPPRFWLPLLFRCRVS